MRIAYVCADPGVPPFGAKGCSIHLQEVVRALLGRGERVTLFASRPSGDPPPGLEKVAVRPIPSPCSKDLLAWEREALDANRSLRLALEREAPFDLVYERHALWSFAAMEHARDAGVPGVLEVNAPLIEEQARYRRLGDRARAARASERAFAAAGTIVAVSSGVAEDLQRFPAARGRVHVVPNGVDPGRFPEALTPSRPGGPGTFTVGFVGTLKAWHGLPVLLEAFDRLRREEPGARLLIVGDGPERPALERDLGARGLLPATVLTGAVRPEEIPGLLASMDAAAAPYPRMETFYFSPLKVFEYMAAGLPVAASRIGQVAEVIRDGENGLLLPPGDPEALAAALRRLRRDPHLRARLGKAARATVMRERSWPAVVERILRLAGRAASPEKSRAGNRGS